MLLVLHWVGEASPSSNLMLMRKPTFDPALGEIGWEWQSLIRELWESLVGSQATMSVWGSSGLASFNDSPSCSSERPNTVALLIAYLEVTSLGFSSCIQSLSFVYFYDSSLKDLTYSLENRSTKITFRSLASMLSSSMKRFSLLNALAYLFFKLFRSTSYCTVCLRSTIWLFSFVSLADSLPRHLLTRSSSR